MTEPGSVGGYNGWVLMDCRGGKLRRDARLWINYCNVKSWHP